MTNNRPRRWLQFGILDLLILIAVVAVVLPLCRPVPQGTARKAMPWVIGFWEDKRSRVRIHLYPDGMYEYGLSYGAGWKLTGGAEVEGAFILLCETDRFIVRSEWGSGVLELLNADGIVQSRLMQSMRIEGPRRRGLPHGQWIFSDPSQPTRDYSVEYRDGEPVDLVSQGKRSLPHLNNFRAVRGLPNLNESDFPPESVATRETP